MALYKKKGTIELLTKKRLLLRNEVDLTYNEGVNTTIISRVLVPQLMQSMYISFNYKKKQLRRE